MKKNLTLDDPCRPPTHASRKKPNHKIRHPIDILIEKIPLSTSVHWQASFSCQLETSDHLKALSISNQSSAPQEMPLSLFTGRITGRPRLLSPTAFRCQQSR